VQRRKGRKLGQRLGHAGDDMAYSSEDTAEFLFISRCLDVDVLGKQRLMMIAFDSQSLMLTTLRDAY
jgi:hypothetical protein